MRSERLRVVAAVAALASAMPAAAVAPRTLDVGLCGGGSMRLPLEEEAPPEPTAAGGCHAVIPCRAKRAG